MKLVAFVLLSLALLVAPGLSTSSHLKALTSTSSESQVSTQTRVVEKPHGFSNAVVRDFGRACDETRKATKAASEAGKDAAELMGVAYTQAAMFARKLHAPAVNPGDRVDLAVAIATIVLNDDVLPILKVADNGETKVVSLMRELMKLPGCGIAGYGLDRTNGRGTLDSRFSDRTNNQAFHTNFFVAAGYVGGRSVLRQTLVRMGNLYHEAIENILSSDGKSVEDLCASAIGRLVGITLHVLRERNVAHPEQTTDLLTGVAVYSMVSKTGSQQWRLPDDVSSLNGVSNVKLRAHAAEIHRNLAGLRDTEVDKRCDGFGTKIVQATNAVRELSSKIGTLWDRIVK